MVGLRASLTKHASVQQKNRMVVGLGGITSNHGSVMVYIRVVEAVEDEASIGKVGIGESDKAEADELEGVDFTLAVTKSDDKDVQLL